MKTVLSWTLAFSAVTAASVTLLGKKELIGGEITGFKPLITLVCSWRFILSMILAVIARGLFIQVNRALLNVVELQNSANTFTVVVTTTFSLASVMISNWIFLDERLTISQ
jgi:hypothetical protein